MTRTLRKIVTFTFLTAISLASSVQAQESSGQYVDDATITTKVKAALLADTQLKALHISVKTTQGTVQLGGTVDSKSQESEAIKVANQINGVKLVSDAMTVRGPQEQ